MAYALFGYAYSVVVVYLLMKIESIFIVKRGKKG
jgi:hypothetical protein